MEHVRVLGDVTDGVPQAGQLQPAYVDAGHRHRAVGGVVEPRDQVGHVVLPPAGAADQRDGLARLDGEGQVVQHRGVRPLVERGDRLQTGQ